MVKFTHTNNNTSGKISHFESASPKQTDSDWGIKVTLSQMMKCDDRGTFVIQYLVLREEQTTSVAVISLICKFVFELLFIWTNTLLFKYVQISFLIQCLLYNHVQQTFFFLKNTNVDLAQDNFFAYCTQVNKLYCNFKFQNCICILTLFWSPITIRVLYKVSNHV